MNRLSQHKRDKPWWAEVSVIKVKHFNNRMFIKNIIPFQISIIIIQKYYRRFIQIKKFKIIRKKNKDKIKKLKIENL